MDDREESDGAREKMRERERKRGVKGKGRVRRESGVVKKRRRSSTCTQERRDADRVELLAANRSRPSGIAGTGALISSRAIVLEPNIIFPSQLPSATSIP